MKKKLSDETLLTLILSGVKQAEIAREYDMSTAYLCRRVNAPEFQKQLSQHRKAVLDSCLSKLTDSAGEAVTVLSELLHHKNGYLRFSAASRILSLIQDFSVQEDLLKQIEELKKSQDTTMVDGGWQS